MSDIMAAKSVGLETLGLAQETITGSGNQQNLDQMKDKMNGAIDSSNKIYQKYLSETLTKMTGVKAAKDLEWCFTNDTVADCP